jgi:tetratricopeptide (TPR) repeat protein
LLFWVASSFVVGLAAAPSPARADDEATEQARKHYLKGKQHFDLGKWDNAIAEFEEAYRLHADSSFLFNMAQAYRRKGDLQHALDLYKNYLIENPESPKRREIEGRIQTLEKEMKRRPAPAASPSEPPPAPAAVVGSAPVLVPAPTPAAVAAPPAAPTVTEPAPPAPSAAPPVAPAVSLAQNAQPSPAPQTQSSGRRLRIAGIVCGAAGLASIGTAIYFYARAVSLSDRVSTSHTPDSDYRSGKTAETMQWVFYSVGAGTLATGSILYFLGWRSTGGGPPATAVAPMFGPGIAGLSAQGTF